VSDRTCHPLSAAAAGAVWHKNDRMLTFGTVMACSVIDDVTLPLLKL